MKNSFTLGFFLGVVSLALAMVLSHNRFKVGDYVTNGKCKGYIGDILEYEFRLDKAVCKLHWHHWDSYLEYNFIYVNKDTVEKIDD